MKGRVFNHIPTYTGDVSGAASALYELGGMVVLHDPSGCNSTYNTHDELRWADQESLIFISGLRESDAVFGRDEPLIDGICEAAGKWEKRRLNFIALANSPVPDIIGTDFGAICRIVEERTGIPAFYIQTNAMHDYTVGAGQAFLALARKLAGQEVGGGQMHRTKAGGGQMDQTIAGSGQMHRTTAGRKRVNLLGVTPLDFPLREQVDELADFVEAAGCEVASVWAMQGERNGYADFSRIERASKADLNLVVSSTGLLAAQYLETAYRMPYVCGIPVDGFREILAERLGVQTEPSAKRFTGREEPGVKQTAEQAGSVVEQFTERKELGAKQTAECSTAQTAAAETGICAGKIAVVGERVAARSIACGLAARGRDAVAVITTEQAGRTGQAGRVEQAGALPVQAPHFETVIVRDEKRLQGILSGASVVAADPLYRSILGKETRLVPVPHLAFSGRIFRRGWVDVLRSGWLESI